MKKIFLIIHFAFYILLSAFSQDTLKAKVDWLVNPQINNGKNIGMMVGIVSDDKTYIYHYGSILKDTLIPPNENTIYEIGSITKVFTATILEDMNNDGIVNVNDPVQKFLPDSVQLKKYSGSELKLAHLANHTSGLPRLPDNLMQTITDELNPYANYTQSDLYFYLKNQFIPKRKSGAKYDYSNLGMGLLGNILAQKENTTYEELVRKRIFEKTGMKNSAVNLSEEQKKNLAQGYNEDGKTVPTWDLPTLAGAGAIKSNIKDMLQFLKANIGVLPNNPLQKIMDSCQLVTISTVNLELEIGTGWHISPLGKNNEAIIWHNGGTGGYRSYIGFVKPEKTGVVILTNSANGVDKIGEKILDLIIPHNPKLEEKKQPEIIKHYQKIYEKK